MIDAPTTVGLLNFNFQFQLYLQFDKRKIQNGRFPQIAFTSRDRKRQERRGLNYSLSDLEENMEKIIEKYPFKY